MNSVLESFNGKKIIQFIKYIILLKMWILLTISGIYFLFLFSYHNKVIPKAMNNVIEKHRKQ